MVVNPKLLPVEFFLMGSVTEYIALLPCELNEFLMDKTGNNDNSTGI